MASAAQLKKLRKKFGLGEFKKKRKRKKQWKVRHKSYHKKNAPRRKRKKTVVRMNRGSNFPSPMHFPLGPSFPGAPMNQFSDSLPTAPTQLSVPMPGNYNNPVDRLIGTLEQDPTVGIFQRADGTTYKVKL